MDSIVEIRNLHKTYESGGTAKEVLKSASMQVARGEMVCITGLSGCGKTTLLNIIGGLDSGFEGCVIVDHVSLKGMSDRALAAFRRDRVGFVFQSFNLLDHLTCEENVALPIFFNRGNQRKYIPEIHRLLDRVGLRGMSGIRPPFLSGGEKQRAAIARALVLRPSVVLCDEPTGDLDRLTAMSILDLFRDLRREYGLTMIVVTHEEHVAARADRVIRLDDGKLAE